MQARCCAIVLAGGRSTRMGRSKALLPWGNSTMLETVVDTLRGVCQPVVIVGHVGQQLPSFSSECFRVDDPAELDDQGPLVGVLRGLQALEAPDVAFLTATDKPYITATHVQWMFDQLGDDDAAVPVEPPHSTRRHPLHPLSGVLRVGPARAVARTLVGNGERALRRLFEHLPCRMISTESLVDAKVLHDVNTPESYRVALTERKSHTEP